MPKISVLMPAYNAEKYIKEAIDSILNQTFTDFEFIIIDDCSTDSTAEIIKSYSDERIKYYKNEQNLGVARTLNRGLDLATGEYIARMDSDDISLPKRFEEQIKFMDKHKDIAVLGTGIEIFGSLRGKRIFSRTSKELKVDLLFGCCLAHPSVMLRAKYFGKNKLHYNPEFSKMEDFDLWERISKDYKMATIPDVLVKYRSHPNQVSNKISESNILQTCKIIKRQWERFGLNNCQINIICDYVLKKFDLSAEFIQSLNNVFSETIIQNKASKIYNYNLLKTTFKNILTKLINKLPSKQIDSVAKLCNINPKLLLLKNKLKEFYHKSKSKVLTFHKRMRLKNKNFTIISNNCWAGFIYQEYGLKYRTPTIGLYIFGYDYVKLCSDLEYYLSLELKFIKWEDAYCYDLLQNIKPYPVARLGDIEIYFMHYHNEEEAAEKWYRRVKRINKKHILFKFSQREGCSKNEIEKFMSLPLKNKLCFSYDEVEGAIHVPELKGFIGDEYAILERYYDKLKILNQL